MRNALVLVLLCIGLTCGFIVPTSTSEESKVTQNTKSLNQETNLPDENKNSNDSVVREDNDLRDMKYDDDHQGLYIEGSEENKTIQERSFIFVNQRWNKFSYKKNNLGDTKKASILNVFREDPRENVVPQVSSVHTKYLNDKHDQHMEYDKARNKTYRTTYEKESRNHSNYGMNSKYHAQNIVSENKNNFIEFLKSSIVRPVIKSNENKLENNKNKKYFMEFNTENHNIEAYRNQKPNITKICKEQDENPSIRNRIQDLVTDNYVNLVTEQKLFHLLLEEPIPDKQVIYKNHNGTYNFKNCQKCARLAKLSNLNVDKECDCRCGRYIHLKGRI